MNLKEIEEKFNKHYNFEELKQYIINSTKELINNWETNYLFEYKDELPNNLTFKDLEIEYLCTHLIINNKTRISPFFRVCVQLNNPKTDIGLYQYEIEYGINGEIYDDYFIEL
ncbi:hypothetical protein [Oceanirhabdus sp. W0125-5]|uniref:hypothetical protein n=1 Tax=Oceanirhabdus sp. W0125-5 TaxID=2999116 RepID=UPI0022F2D167|nr:hypothetical protein [Oceanirhabdus sp. W0125-5]WBW95235.1 hypothetical protein OW730_16245 [Oceanirhabdus sp. W0125-5]